MLTLDVTATRHFLDANFGTRRSTLAALFLSHRHVYAAVLDRPGKRPLASLTWTKSETAPTTRRG